MGLDPGIDHMLAMDCIDQAKADGCMVESYSSFCGGIPAPECTDNPLRYKFSWSPYGVLLNTISSAVYLKDNKVISIPPGGALLDSVAPMDFLPGFNLEGFPNRDSTKYAEAYGIESAHTLIRGTLRFKGFSSAMSGFIKLGLINAEPCPMLDHAASPVSWKELLCHVMGLQSSVSHSSFLEAVYDRIGKEDHRMETLKWFGMLSDEPVPHADSILDAVAKHLETRMPYLKGERDMVIMRNDVGIRHRRGAGDQTRQPRGVRRPQRLLRHGEDRGLPRRHRCPHGAGRGNRHKGVGDSADQENLRSCSEALARGRDPVHHKEHDLRVALTQQLSNQTNHCNGKRSFFLLHSQESPWARTGDE